MEIFVFPGETKWEITLFYEYVFFSNYSMEIF